MKVRQTVLLCALSFVLAIAAYVLLLALGIMLPRDARIAQNLRASVDEGLLSQDSDTSHSDYGHTVHAFDMFSECIGLDMNLGNRDRPVLYRVFASPYISSDPNQPPGFVNSRPCADLVQALKGQPKANLPYLRFWQGNQIYVRTVLNFTDLARLRILNAILFYGCLLYLCFQIKGWFGPWGVFLFLFPYAFESDLFSEPLITYHVLGMAWTFLSVALCMRLLEKNRTFSTSLFVLTFLSGSFYSFVTTLITPQLGPALMAFMAIAAFVRWDGAPARRLRALWMAALLAFVWFLGFALTWIAKWVLAAAYLGVAVVRASVLSAASGTHYEAYRDPKIHRLFGASAMLLRPWMLKLLVVELIFIAIVILWRKSPNGASPATQALNWALLQTPLLVVFAWTEVMHFHSAEHWVFALRAMMLVIMFPPLALLLLRRKDSAALS